MAVQQLANMRIQLVEKDPEGVRELKPQLFKDAVKALEEFLAIARAREDNAGTVHGLLELGRMYIMNKDGANAVETGEEAVAVASKMDDEECMYRMALASILTAEGHLAAGNMQEAKTYAEDALVTFETIGDEARIQQAKKVMSQSQMPPQAKAKPKATPKRFGDPKASFMPPARAGAEDPMQRELRPPPNHLPQWRQKKQEEDERQRRQAAEDEEEDQEPARYPGPRPTRRGFSAMAESLQKPPPTRVAPNQELRRQQMLESMNAKASPTSSTAPSAAAMEKNPMWSVLHSVRPDWNVSELRIVQEKMQAINILSVDALYEVLRDVGAAGVNTKLKEVGKRPMKVETLESILAHAQNN